MEKLTTFKPETITTKTTKVNPLWAQIDAHLPLILSLTKSAVGHLAEFFSLVDVADNLSVVAPAPKDDARMLKRVNTKQKLRNAVIPTNLPFHITDDAWLAEYFVKFLTRKAPNLSVNNTTMLQYFNESAAFQYARNNFINNMVKSQITQTQVDEPSRADRRRYDQTHELFAYEDLFRNQMILGMHLVGVDANQTERILEINADLWRRQQMSRSFDAFFYPLKDRPRDPRQAKRWDNLQRLHRAEWLKYREYQYYQEHRAVIDQTDTANRNMKMTPSAVGEVLQEIGLYDDMRREFINDQMMQDWTR